MIRLKEKIEFFVISSIPLVAICAYLISLKFICFIHSSSYNTLRQIYRPFCVFLSLSSQVEQCANVYLCVTRISSPLPTSMAAFTAV